MLELQRWGVSPRPQVMPMAAEPVRGSRTDYSHLSKSHCCQFAASLLRRSAFELAVPILHEAPVPRDPDLSSLHLDIPPFIPDSARKESAGCAREAISPVPIAAVQRAGEVQGSMPATNPLPTPPVGKLDPNKCDELFHPEIPRVGDERFNAGTR